MVKAAMTTTTREPLHFSGFNPHVSTNNATDRTTANAFKTRDPSSTMNNMQLVLSTMHNDAELEEIKRQYNAQNRLLAQKNEELHMKVTNLERQLFESQRQILTLKNDKIQLMDKLKLNSKRFNDLIVDGFENLLTEYRSCMADVGVDIERQEIPLKLLKRVSQKEDIEARTFNPDAYEFEYYWKNVNDDLQRRKSILVMPKNGRENEGDCNDASIQDNDDQLATLVENPQAEEEAEKPLEPAYEDTFSSLIPVKRQSIVRRKLEHSPMLEIPFLGLEPHMQESAIVSQNELNSASDDMLNPMEDISIQESPVRRNLGTKLAAQEEILYDTTPSVQDRETSKTTVPISATTTATATAKVTKKSRPRIAKKRVPRELKNLDTEKTKRWLGMDPLDDVEESTSDRRKSRRRSLVVNYQIPSFKETDLSSKNRRASGRFHNTIFIDDNKENSNDSMIGKGKGKGEASSNVLRNVTNTNQASGLKGTQKRQSGKSIFDLENMDTFGEYDRGISSRRRQSSAYDMLL